MAALFFREYANVEPSVKENLLAAAEAYEQEAHILGKSMEKAPFCTAPEEERLRMAERSLRVCLSENILQAKAKDQLAVENLEKALEKLDNQ